MSNTPLADAVFGIIVSEHDTTDDVQQIVEAVASLERKVPVLIAEVNRLNAVMDKLASAFHSYGSEGISEFIRHAMKPPKGPTP